MLRFDVETLELPAMDNQQIVMAIPADTATAAALDDLRRHATGALRVVS